ncbi:MAG TPA: hypothetical protein VEI03_01860 [Stellaceae bacterium]|nr:hypothetical protein [Stellaceae bacterium]
MKTLFGFCRAARAMAARTAIVFGRSSPDEPVSETELDAICLFRQGVGLSIEAMVSLVSLIAVAQARLGVRRSKALSAGPSGRAGLAPLRMISEEGCRVARRRPRGTAAC